MASGDADRSQKSSAELLNVGEKPAGVESLLLLNRKGVVQPASSGPEPRATFRVPASSVLGRVRAFLPQMRDAEATLQQRVASDGADAVCIEADDSARPHIELSLGLCELDSGADSDSESSEDSESESDSGDPAPVGPVTAANLRLPGGGGGGGPRPLVTELGRPAGDERLGE